MVDRRFNRARYDADQTIAAFAARLKDTVVLDSIQDDLATVVHLALEPRPRFGVDQPAGLKRQAGQRTVGSWYGRGGFFIRVASRSRK